MSSVTTRDLLTAPSRSGHSARAPALSAWLLLLATLALVATVLATGQAPRPPVQGLPDAGPWVTWLVLASRTVFRVASVGAVGCLLTATCLLPAAGGRLSPAARDLLRAASVWAVVWGAAVALLMLTTSAELLGIPFREAVTSGQAWRYVPELPEGRALMLMVPVALAVALHARLLRHRGPALALLLAALVVMTPMLTTGHASTAVDHEVAVQSQVLHVLAITVWAGGVIGLAHLRGHRDVLAAAACRFSPLALLGFIVVGLSGLSSAWTRLGLSVDAWLSTYGGLVVAKAAALVILGAIGWRHRRRTLPAVTSGTPGGFARLVGGEAALMAATFGVAAVLARTSLPDRRDAVAGAGGHSSEFGLLAISPRALLLEVRWDSIVITAAVVGVAGYLLGVRRLRRQGCTWARARVGFFLVGVAATVWTLCGGPAAYASALFSVQVTQFLLCAVVLPRLLARGEAGRLLAALGVVRTDSEAPGRLTRALRDPLNGAVALAVVLWVVYSTPVLALALESTGFRQTVNIAALAVGLVACGALTTRSQDQLDPAQRRTADLMAGAMLTVFGLVVVSADRLYGGEWFPDLNWSWSNPRTDQTVAGVLVLLLAAGLFLHRARVGLGRTAGTREG